MARIIEATTPPTDRELIESLSEEVFKLKRQVGALCDVIDLVTYSRSVCWTEEERKRLRQKLLEGGAIIR